MVIGELKSALTFKSHENGGLSKPGRIVDVNCVKSLIIDNVINTTESSTFGPLVDNSLWLKVEYIFNLPVAPRKSFKYDGILILIS